MIPSQNDSEERPLTVREVVNSIESIKKMEYCVFVKVYLSFINFLDNQHKVNSEERETAARNYYCVFIAEKVPKELKGRKLIERTILHILDWMFINP